MRKNSGCLREIFSVMMAVALALMPVLSPLSQRVALAAPLEDALPFAAEAPSVMLLEVESGRVIAEKNADEKRPAASIVKEMSLLLIFEALGDGRLALDDDVTVSRTAAGIGGSQALLDAGSAYPAEALIRSIIVASANDATLALAEHLYGSETAFAERMNQKAQAMGLENSVFINATGLPAEGQHTTARDIAVMSRALLSIPEYTRWSTIWTTQITHKNGRVTDLVNTNRLIRFYEGADGVKTGSTDEAKNCIAASAQRGGLHLLAIVLGAEKSKERFDIASRLLDYGFDHYLMVELFKQGDLIEAAVPVRGGRENRVDLVAGENVRLMVRKGDEKRITADGVVPEVLHAPLDGTPIAQLAVFLGDVQVATVDVVPAHAIGRPGLLGAVARVLERWVR